jgi:hypothetical protein
MGSRRALHGSVQLQERLIRKAEYRNYPLAAAKAAEPYKTEDRKRREEAAEEKRRSRRKATEVLDKDRLLLVVPYAKISQSSDGRRPLRAFTTNSQNLKCI